MNQILHGDALTMLKTLPDESVHCCVTDPPYELGFMGKQWDKSGVAYNVDLWREVRRVLKPGGHLLAFGGSRTHHRIWCAIEDAGFEIRDTIMWVYGSGFPKSLDVSKAIDKAAGADVTVSSTDAAQQWQGWGTALKPAYEPIVVARKPIVGTVAQNVLKHGTGAINIDGCRIPTNGEELHEGAGGPLSHVRDGKPYPNPPHHNYGRTSGEKSFCGKGPAAITPPTGRWPANIILDEEAGAALDEQGGILTSGNNPSKRSADKHRTVYAGWKGERCLVHRGTDSGYASRFFYCAKASPSERGKDNNHPTVKPAALIEYLVKLVSREGGIVLDPFFGSGTTGLVCSRLNRDYIGIELNEQYIEMAKRRIEGDAPLLNSGGTNG
jgi:site-specific DNA-methyltransferase (adenine-specific)